MANLTARQDLTTEWVQLTTTETTIRLQMGTTNRVDLAIGAASDDEITGDNVLVLSIDRYPGYSDDSLADPVWARSREGEGNFVRFAAW